MPEKAAQRFNEDLVLRCRAAEFIAFVFVVHAGVRTTFDVVEEVSANLSDSVAYTAWRDTPPDANVFVSKEIEESFEFPAYITDDNSKTESVAVVTKRFFVVAVPPRISVTVFLPSKVTDSS